MKTVIEIINETVKYYSEDISRRSIDEKSNCVYCSTEGKMCAIGRCMIDPNMSTDEAIGFFKSDAIRNCKQDKILKPEYHGHSNDFWVNLQKLHDFTTLWSDQGLTDRGTTYVDKLKKEYATD